MAFIWACRASDVQHTRLQILSKEVKCGFDRLSVSDCSDHGWYHHLATLPCLQKAFVFAGHPASAEFRWPRTALLLPF